MKKNLLVLFLLLGLFITYGCQNNNNQKTEKIELLNITGLTYIDAVVLYDGDITLNPVYTESNEILPGSIISYGAGLKQGDKVDLGMTIDVIVAKKPSNAITYDTKVEYVAKVSTLTGPNSIENGSLLLDAGIYGTDLGIPVEVKDEMIFLFGDSFSSANMKGLWYSNFISKSTDNIFYDGLSFDSVISTPSGMALPFRQGAHQEGNEFNNNVEVTKIPTGGITIGDTTYIFYMSIRYWGVGGSWNVNYNQCVKSKDLVNWEDVKSVKFTENDAPNFAQVYVMKDINSDYYYLYGNVGGRQGGTCVARTSAENFENMNNYEYLVSKDTWVKGNTGLQMLKKEPYYIISAPVGELSVCYNTYLKKYMTVFYRNSKLIMLTSNTPYDVFSNSIVLLTNVEVEGIYGGFIHPNYLTDDGKSFYMTVSSWKDYNVYWYKVVLK